MPLSSTLLEPIEGENPSGANLYYEKIFDQIKEARTEDTELGSAGAWERTLKKADHALVIKLASETLSKRTKDLRLVGWLIESHLRREGMAILPACLELLQAVQDSFWATLYPEIDEDGDLGLRITAIEGTINRIGTLLRVLPITKAGHNAAQYGESRRLGYEEAADTSDKRTARQDAIDQGQITPEDFDAGLAATAKASLVGVEAALTASTELLDQLGAFHEDKYGDDYPALNKLTATIDEVKQVVSALLYEKRKTDPDPVAVEAAEAEPEEEAFVPDEPEPVEEEAPVAAPVRAAAPTPKAAKASGFGGMPTTAEQAQAAVLGGAVFLQGEAAASPAPYLICSGLRFGETRLEGSYPASDFAVAPPTETRQLLRRLANEGNWDELLKSSLRTLIEPCARAWLDLHRYIWRAASSNGQDALAKAVVATVRGLLQDIPELRSWSMDDDTPVGNAETQQWIDAEVLPPAPELVVVTEEEPAVEAAPVYTPPPSPAADAGEPARPAIYDEAVALLKAKRAGEAIQLLVRDAELQPSGRSKFQRRVQVAQLCLAAGQGTIAYPILQELSREAERRGLETWETGQMLAQPLALLLKCLDRRGSPPEEKEALFERLCRLDPQAALDLNS